MNVRVENARGWSERARVGREQRHTRAATRGEDRLIANARLHALGFHAPCLRAMGIDPAAATAVPRTFLRLYNVTHRRGGSGVPPSQANRETKEVEVSRVVGATSIEAYQRIRAEHGETLFTTRVLYAHESKEGSPLLATSPRAHAPTRAERKTHSRCRRWRCRRKQRGSLRARRETRASLSLCLCYKCEDSFSRRECEPRTHT